MACCVAYQPTHRFVVAWRQDADLGRSGLALAPILQLGQIVLCTAFASEGKEGVNFDVTPFPPTQLSPWKGRFDAKQYERNCVKAKQCVTN